MRKALAAGCLLAALLAGCRGPAVTFPAMSVDSAAREAGAWAAYDTDQDHRADFYHFVGPQGWVRRLGYDLDGDGQIDELIDLDLLDNRHCRHLVIILDGFSYDLVRRYWEEGGLRVLRPPSIVVSPYPTMTDASLEDLLDYTPCEGFEAKFYDRRRHRMVGGAMAYLHGFNQPYNQLLDYRANIIWDVVGYVSPRPVFGRELNHVKRQFDRASSQEMLAYLVSTAGMSTRHGAAGQQECLRDIERLVNQVIWQTRGLTRVTLLSDHGHTYTQASRLDLESYLKDRGWTVTEKPKGQGRKEVVPLRFGLVNYAGFVTDRRAELAKDLAENPHVLLASYADGDHVVVLAGNRQQAIVDRCGDRFSYQAISGDPLQLAPLLPRLQADEKGFYDSQQLLEATADHIYPDPLYRLWRAHLGLVHTPPDVIISLDKEHCYGLESFARRVDIASTHGSLERCSSLAMAMTNAGPLPPVMRSDQLPAALGSLVGWPWPAKR
jgi:hypothetical protein